MTRQCHLASSSFLVCQRAQHKVLHIVLTFLIGRESHFRHPKTFLPSNQRERQRSQKVPAYHSLATDGTLSPCSKSSKASANAAVGLWTSSVSETVSADQDVPLVRVPMVTPVCHCLRTTLSLLQHPVTTMASHTRFLGCTACVKTTPQKDPFSRCEICKNLGYRLSGR